MFSTLKICMLELCVTDSEHALRYITTVIMAHSSLHIHLVSDSTGETVHQVARAALAQFPDVQISEHIWTLVRTPAHVETIASALTRNPGILLYSVVDPEIRRLIERALLRKQHSQPVSS